jgi:adenylosuccinate lyase
MWAYDLYLVLEAIQNKYKSLKMRGVKGTTGTQASFIDLFNGNPDFADRLDDIVCKTMGFENKYLLCGQVYPRIDDAMLFALLAAIAASCQKNCNRYPIIGKQRTN